MASRTKGLGNGSIRGQEPLGLSSRLKSLHPSLPLTGWLVGVLRAIIEVAVFDNANDRHALNQWSCTGLSGYGTAKKLPL
jgi:hypothetical protein